MHTIATRSNLSKALSLAAKAVAPKPVIPLFSNIMYESNESHSIISATNFEIGVSVKIPSVGDCFKIAIPAKTFTDLISVFQAEEVALALNESTQELKITTNKTRNNIKCVSAGDFPSIARISAPKVMLHSTHFKEMVNRVAFCASRTTESSISGVMMKMEGNDFLMYAVDGFHLALERTPLDIESDINFTAIVRADTLETIARMVDPDKDLFMETTANKILFRCGDLDIECQLIDGKFPDYKLLSPPEYTTKVTLSTTELLRACKQLEVFAGDSGKARFEGAGMMVNFSIDSTDRGDGNVTMATVVEGDPITVGMNVYYLHEFLEVCSTSEVELHFSGPKKPIALYMPGMSIQYHHIIMPIGL